MKKIWSWLAAFVLALLIIPMVTAIIYGIVRIIFKLLDLFLEYPDIWAWSCMWIVLLGFMTYVIHYFRIPEAIYKLIKKGG